MNFWDIIEIEYIGKVEGKIFDLATSKDIKGFENLDKEKRGPKVIILGCGNIIKGLEKVLLEMEIGEEREVEISPQEGFGIRKRELVKAIPEREFSKNKIAVARETLIRVNGRIGRIIGANSGRVIVDFNHPLAGKKLNYWIKILRKIEKKEEKVKNILNVLGLKNAKTEIKGKWLQISGISESSADIFRIKKIFEKCAPEIDVVVKEQI